MPKLIVNPLFEKTIRHKLETAISKYMMVGIGPGEIIHIRTKHLIPNYMTPEDQPLFKPIYLFMNFTFEEAKEVLKYNNLHILLTGLLDEYPFIGIKAVPSPSPPPAWINNSIKTIGDAWYYWNFYNRLSLWQEARKEGYIND